MKSDFLVAITQLAAEKNLPKDLVLRSVEAALVSAYKKDLAMAEQDVAVKISPGSGEVKVYLRKLVVEEPNNPETEIALKEAKKVKSDIEVDDILDIEIKPANAGRIAALQGLSAALVSLRHGYMQRVRALVAHVEARWSLPYCVALKAHHGTRLSLHHRAA